jgi:hypothetical protein
VEELNWMFVVERLEESVRIEPSVTIKSVLIRVGKEMIV